jgi:hypothetical protein
MLRPPVGLRQRGHLLHDDGRLVDIAQKLVGHAQHSQRPFGRQRIGSFASFLRHRPEVAQRALDLSEHARTVRLDGSVEDLRVLEQIRGRLARIEGSPSTPRLGNALGEARGSPIVLRADPMGDRELPPVANPTGRLHIAAGDGQRTIDVLLHLRMLA